VDSRETIYRYHLTLTDYPQVIMPVGAQVLSVAAARHGPGIDIWALVDPAAPKEVRKFRIIGTGNPTSGGLGRFIGTVSTYEGALIWHVFESA
jgi:hypothetical protein